MQQQALRRKSIFPFRSDNDENTTGETQKAEIRDLARYNFKP
jgi:hypothetical protein